MLSLPRFSPRTRSIVHPDCARRPQLWILGMLGVLALSTSVLAACGTADPGHVTAEYILGNGKGCEELLISTVEGRLVPVAAEESDEEDDQAGLEPVEAAATACAAPGLVEFDSVDPGLYELHLRARNHEGVVVMDNVFKANPEPPLEVLGDGLEVVVPSVALGDSPGYVKLRWLISDGFITCQDMGIGFFRVSTWDEAGTEALHTADIACSDPPVDNQGHRLLPDPRGNIKGKRFGEASVVAHDINGNAISSPAYFELPQAVQPGYTAYLTLLCENGLESCAGAPPIVGP